MKRIIPVILMLLVLLTAASAFAAEQISFTDTEINIFEGEQHLLAVNISDGLEGGTVTYKSANNNTVTVDANGLINGVSKGTANVTATLKTAKQTYTAKVKVNVLRAVTSAELNEENLNVLTAEDGLNFALAQSIFSDGLPEAEYDTGLSLERIIILAKGRKLTAGTVIKPNSASDKSVTLTTSNEAVLPLQKQTFTAKETGSSMITVASVSNPEIMTVYGVLVVEPVTKLSVDTVRTTIGVGGVTQLNVSFEPVNPTYKAVRWTSDNPKIATVDEYGMVTGVARGNATIRAAALDGSNKKDSVTIRVQLMPTSVEITSDQDIMLATGKSVTAKANVLPTNASNRGVTWSSTAPEIARVNSEGRITGVSLGSCDIIAASAADPDITARVHVTVIQEITSLRFTERSMELSTGGTAYAQIEINPANASNPAVTYSVDNTKVATVDAFGMITAVAKGTTTVRVKATDGSNKSASMSLTVVQPPESITLDKPDVSVNTGRSVTVRATVMPRNANNTRVNWESTDPSIAKVNSEGQITGVKAGSCQVICRARGDESVTAIVNVTVHQLITKITPAEKILTVNVKESTLVRWTVEPYDVTDSSVTLSSNKPAIATVDQDGTVHGLKRGECTITIKANDGGNKQATVRINVLQPVEGVYMKESNYQTDVDDSVRLTAQLIPSDASNTKMTWYSQDESIATVKGTGTRPTVTGRRWGTVQITGVTEDGNFSASTWVTVQNYDTAIRPTDLYLSNNEVKLAMINVSNLNVTRIEFTVQCFDNYNVPLACNVNGANFFDGIYQYTLGEGESTRHGRFNFIDYLQPYEQIGRVVLTVTGYRVQEGWKYDVPIDKQLTLEYLSPSYIGEVVPEVNPEGEPEYIVQEETQPEPVG